jgi:hypothetical protein
MGMLNNIVILLVISGYSFAGTTSFLKDWEVPSFKTERSAEENTIVIKKVEDFNLTGSGSDINWEKTKWNVLTKLDGGGQDYESKFKILYSDKGLYVLFYGQDNKISTTYDTDFDKLWNGDVFEIFFHPNPQLRKYFEYQVNPLNKELVIIIDRSKEVHNAGLQSYEGTRRIKKKVEVLGGKVEMNSPINSWTAELFFPFELLKDLPNSPPVSGTVWNANFARIDYDTDNKIRWSWTPTIDYTFHELEKFRKIRFE